MCANERINFHTFTNKISMTCSLKYICWSPNRKYLKTLYKCNLMFNDFWARIFGKQANARTAYRFFYIELDNFAQRQYIKKVSTSKEFQQLTRSELQFSSSSSKNNLIPSTLDAIIMSC